MTEAGSHLVDSRTTPSKAGCALRRGTFISFEGTEGSGKTTQMRLLVERLRGLGLRVTENQEPGATAIGTQIRRILLDPENEELAPKTELLLMFASRTQAAAQIIIPALERGDIVVSDRFTDSTLAYQGIARGLGFEAVMQVHRLALGDLMPDMTICTYVDVELGLARAQRRNATQHDQTRPDEARLDQQSLDFHLRVAEGYRKIASLEPHRFRMIDGTGTHEQVAERVWSEVAPLIQVPAGVR
jgi:dTMP kinase